MLVLSTYVYCVCFVFVFVCLFNAIEKLTLNPLYHSLIVTSSYRVCDFKNSISSFVRRSLLPKHPIFLERKQKQQHAKLVGIFIVSLFLFFVYALLFFHSFPYFLFAFVLTFAHSLITSYLQSKVQLLNFLESIKSLFCIECLSYCTNLVVRVFAKLQWHGVCYIATHTYTLQTLHTSQYLVRSKEKWLFIGILGNCGTDMAFMPWIRARHTKPKSNKQANVRRNRCTNSQNKFPPCSSLTFHSMRVCARVCLFCSSNNHDVNNVHRYAF